MSMERIRKLYNVPAKRGGRVAYRGDGFMHLGTIRSAKGLHLRIKLDMEKITYLFHPTWELEYLES